MYAEEKSVSRFPCVPLTRSCPISKYEEAARLDSYILVVVVTKIGLNNHMPGVAVSRRSFSRSQGTGHETRISTILLKEATRLSLRRDETYSASDPVFPRYISDLLCRIVTSRSMVSTWGHTGHPTPEQPQIVARRMSVGDSQNSRITVRRGCRVLKAVR